jgi:hypothetical protein
MATPLTQRALFTDDSFEGRLVKFDLNPRRPITDCGAAAFGHRLDVGKRRD